MVFMRLHRYLDKNLLSQPYRLLPVMVFIYVALAFLYHPFSPFQTFRLSDPDDYMRLNEVINWLQGQGWHDLSHPRLSPGDHVVLHWSRLVDLPIALIAWPLSKFFDIQRAVMVGALVVPMALMALLLALLPALAEPLVGKDRANFAAIFALFAPLMLFNFTPGRVDHHNWEILIAGFGLLCLERMTRSKEGWREAILAAMAFGCGLWIGTEAMPWLVLFIACLTLAGAWNGGYILRNGAVFGLALVFSNLCLLPIAVPYEEWNHFALSWFSPTDVLFAALSGGMLALGWASGRLTKKKWLRMALMGSLVFLAAAIFIRLVPQVFNGPFADLDEFNSSIALDNIAEATPLSAAFRIDIHNHLTYGRAAMAFIRFLFLPLLALGAVLYQLRNAKQKDRQAWDLHGVFLVTSIMLTVFGQIRIGWFMQMFAIGPLVWLLFTWWKKIGKELKGRTRFWAEIGAFVVLGPLAVLFIPALAGGMSVYPDLLLFPAAHGDNSICDLKRVSEFMTGPFGHYSDPHMTILSGANEGAELLYRTPYNVIAANFNVPANKDVFNFFNARDDKTSIRVARKWGADLVLTCRHAPPFYAGLDHPGHGQPIYLRKGDDGKLHLASSLEHPTLIEKLVNGQPPHWLKPVEIPGAKDYLLFEVDLPAAKK